MRQHGRENQLSLHNTEGRVLVVGSKNYLEPALRIANDLQGQPIKVVHEPRIDHGVWDEDSKTIVAGSDSMWFLVDPRRAIERIHIKGLGDKPTIRRWIKKGEDGEYCTSWSIRHAIVYAAIDRRAIFRRDV